MKNWLDYLVIESKEDYLQNTEYHTPLCRMVNNGDIREPKEYPACFRFNPYSSHYINKYPNDFVGTWEPCESNELLEVWKYYLQEKTQLIKEVEKIVGKEKKYYIFIDDERNLNIDNSILDSNMFTIICRTYADAIEILKQCQNEKIQVWIDLDHDLGEEKTGYDICKYIVENQIPILGYHLHTMNPVGWQNMNQLLSHYGYTRF